VFRELRLSGIIQKGIIFLLFLTSVMARTIHIPADFASIQAGIAAAQSGDTIKVAPGLYYERLHLKPGVLLSGSGHDVTIIDGSGAGDVIIGADRGIITGFTIRNSGLMNCAIRCIGVSPVIRKNQIIRNGSGIICIDGANPIIEFNIISRCDDGSEFGTLAVLCNRSSPTIINNTISYNASRFAVSCDSAFPLIKNNIISNNWGGIGCFNEAAPILRYNNIWHNSTFGDLSDCERCDCCISDNPQFIDPANDNFSLGRDSPCIGRGDPSDQSPCRPRIDLGAIPYQQQ